MRRAAMLALWVADDHLILRGERAIANGWFQRAARLLDGLEPCPEHGWLDALLGYVATVDGDPARARALAVRARELGRRLAVVSRRDVRARGRGPGAGERRRGRGRHALPRRGHRRRAGGRVRGDRGGGVDLLLLAQCVRARARLRARRGVVRQGRGVQPRDEDELRHARLPGALRCRADLAGPLARGRALARRGDESSPPSGRPGGGWRSCGSPTCAAARGASPRPRSSSSRAAGNALAPVVMAELALDLGDVSTAVDLLEPVLRRVPPQNRTLRAAPLEVMVRAQVATGEAEAAAVHLEELRSIADAIGTRPLRASVSVSDGLVAAAAGDHDTARERLEDAVELFAASGASFELGRARVELARVLASLAREDAAVREATLALTASRRDRSGWPRRRGLASCWWASGPPLAARRAAPRDRLLTPRELEILRLVAEGLTDGEIANAARAQQAHRPPPHSERLRQAALLLAGRGRGEGEPASPPLAAARAHGRMASTGHARSWPDQAKTPPPHRADIRPVSGGGPRSNGGLLWAPSLQTSGSIKPPSTS